jgi:hypothetical protein
MSTPENNTPNQPDNNEKQEEKKQEQPAKVSPMISHQRMLSAIVINGYEGLTDEERAYWNSVY